MPQTPDTYWDLFLSYSFFWGVIFFFLLSVISRQRKLLDKLEQLKD